MALVSSLIYSALTTAVAAFAMTMTTDKIHSHPNTPQASTPATADTGASLSKWPPLLPPTKPLRECLVDTSPGDTVGAMNYCSPEVTGVRARRDLGGTDGDLEGARWETHDMAVRNARHRNSEMSLDGNGFQMVPDPLVRRDNEQNSIDFLDQGSVANSYYPRCEALLARLTGASVVRAFDHNVRSAGRPGVPVRRNKAGASPGEKVEGEGDEEGQVPVVQSPAGIVHNDYTRASAPRRLEQLSHPPKANDVERLEPLLSPDLVRDALGGRRRYAFVNVWRNIDPSSPAAGVPLALTDARRSNNSADKDLLIFEIVYEDRIGENYLVRYNPDHEWWYYRDLTVDEALLIKQWDSDGGIARGRGRDFGGPGDDDGGKSTFTIHSAFVDSTAPPDAPPRESIEVRCALLWDVEEDGEDDPERNGR